MTDKACILSLRERKTVRWLYNFSFMPRDTFWSAANPDKAGNHTELKPQRSMPKLRHLDLMWQTTGEGIIK